jgi:hypothetical protein
MDLAKSLFQTSPCDMQQKSPQKAGRSTIVWPRLLHTCPPWEKYILLDREVQQNGRRKISGSIKVRWRRINKSYFWGAEQLYGTSDSGYMQPADRACFWW